MKRGNETTARRREGPSLAKSVAVLVASMLALPTLMAGSYRCGWTASGAGTPGVACATTPDRLDCTAATSGAVCETVPQRAYCWSGVDVCHTTTFWPFWTANCTGTTTWTKTCQFIRNTSGTGSCNCLF